MAERMVSRCRARMYTLTSNNFLPQVFQGRTIIWLLRVETADESPHTTSQKPLRDVHSQRACFAASRVPLKLSQASATTCMSVTMINCCQQLSRGGEVPGLGSAEHCEWLRWRTALASSSPTAAELATLFAASMPSAAAAPSTSEAAPSVSFAFSPT